MGTGHLETRGPVFRQDVPIDWVDRIPRGHKDGVIFLPRCDTVSDRLDRAGYVRTQNMGERDAVGISGRSRV